MTQSVLIQTLRKLNKNELENWVAWVKLPQINQNQEVIRLVEYVGAHLHIAKPNMLSPEAMCAATFKNKQMDLPRLRHLMSYTMEATRRYLAFLAFEQETAVADLLLSKELSNRGLDKEAAKIKENLLKNLQKQSERDAQWHLLNYQTSQISLEEQIAQNRSKEIDLNPSIEHLTVFYLSEIFRNACTALTHQAMSEKTYNLAPLHQAFLMAETSNWLDFPAISVYYWICKALLEDNVAKVSKQNDALNTNYFEQWKTVIQNYQHSFSQTELRSIYLMAINFCIRRMNAGSEFYKRAAFELYQKALKQGFLEEKGWLSVFTYKNIIRLGIGLGEKAWTLAFFENYKKQLHPSKREAHYKFNQAFLQFKENAFESVIVTLRDLNLEELEDSFILLDTRRMLLRAYFELNEWQALDSLLKSFAILLKRQSNLGYHQEMNLNLIKFTRLLMNIEMGKGKKTGIFEAIEAEPLLAERSWLLEKINN
jgi:hypothetical protein